MATRDELVAVVAERYARSARKDRSRILDEFTAVSGLHRKHAMRLLRIRSEPSGPRRRRRVYDDAVREALILVWEASDRVCGKRLRPLIPILVESMERHGHLKLAPEVGNGLLAMSAATIDRSLCKVKEQATGGARRRSASSTGSGAACRFEHSMAGMIRHLGSWRPTWSRMRADGRRQFRADADIDRHCERLDGVCTVIGPGADAVDRGVERGPQADAVSSARV